LFRDERLDVHVKVHAICVHLAVARLAFECRLDSLGVFRNGPIAGIVQDNVTFGVIHADEVLAFQRIPGNHYVGDVQFTILDNDAADEVLSGLDRVVEIGVEAFTEGEVDADADGREGNRKKQHVPQGEADA
jgi:hypothetical protein